MVRPARSKELPVTGLLKHASKRPDGDESPGFAALLLMLNTFWAGAAGGPSIPGRFATGHLKACTTPLLACSFPIESQDESGKAATPGLCRLRAADLG